MKALKRMTKEELIQELKGTRRSLTEALSSLSYEKELRRSDVQRTREAMQNKISMVSTQYQEWKELAEKNMRELRAAERDRDFFRRILEKMSR